ncbi:hypothetical protein PHLGIDRAFT_121171 [Phlebiopsis gigantea 11061_1 CR5-6]|uniref:Protein kinase domain-containing protein n=1 Tax=Phlebiopsis gigantea (strain 11061_1 CR5-6) TaxID=745531 RepID=A0A0C3S643_PHLG1|nr:hypothetical protein PHLGIDRAFT_121171 [Phlebiopsis gigantea 11061_1 CR5-6]
MSVALTAVDFIDDMRPTLGPKNMALTLQAIEDAVMEPMWHNKAGFGGRGGYLGDIDGITRVLDDTLTRITEFSTWGYLWGYWYDKQIRQALKESDEDIELAIHGLEIMATNESVNIVKQIQDCPTERAEEIAQRLNQVAQLLSICQESSRSFKDLPVGTLQEDCDAAITFLHDLQEVMHEDESDLHIEGVRVSRTQYNAVFKDVMACLYKIRLETGAKLEVQNFKKELWKIPESLWLQCVPGFMTRMDKGYLYQQEKVMVKRYILSDSSNEATKVRVLGQIKEWSHFRHPRIHNYIGITDNYHELAIVSAFYEKGNITTYTMDNKRKNKYRLLAGAVEGLIYLHEECSVCHGDFKGSNVLITDEGEPLVADFEMSKLFPELLKRTWCEWPRQPTPRWRAAEILAKGLPPTTMSDVWSVGMVMLEVLTGRKPFDYVNADILIYSHVGKDGVRPTRPGNNEQISDDAWRLMEDCWATNPEDRPKMREVHARLLELDAWWEETQPEPPVRTRNMRE